MPRSPFRPLAMPLMMTLVLGVPRFVHETSDETEDGAGTTKPPARHRTRPSSSPWTPHQIMAGVYPPPTRTTPMRTGHRIGLTV